MLELCSLAAKFAYRVQPYTVWTPVWGQYSPEKRKQKALLLGSDDLQLSSRCTSVQLFSRHFRSVLCGEIRLSRKVLVTGGLKWFYLGEGCWPHFLRKPLLYPSHVVYMFPPSFVRQCQDLRLPTVRLRKEVMVVPGWSDKNHDKNSQNRRIQNGYITNTVLKPWDNISLVVKVTLHITKTCGVVEVQIHSFLISTLDKQRW